MLTKITLLTSLVFCIIYPLCFLISIKEPLKEGFHKFHLGLPCVIGGMYVAVIVMGDYSVLLQQITLLWGSVLLILSFYYWNKDFPQAMAFTIPFIIGFLTLLLLLKEIELLSLFNVISIMLGGFIFSSSLYAMNLGHWYLNVHGLPLKHLRNASYAFWAFLVLRAIFDIGIVMTQTVFYNYEQMSLLHFMMSLDGFFLWIAFLFGLIFPILTMFFVKETIRLKNTQSTTGILYVILSAILLSDMTYKYYLIKYAIPL